MSKRDLIRSGLRLFLRARSHGSLMTLKFLPPPPKKENSISTSPPNRMVITNHLPNQSLNPSSLPFTRVHHMLSSRMLGSRSAPCKPSDMDQALKASLSDLLPQNGNGEKLVFAAKRLSVDHCGCSFLKATGYRCSLPI